MTLPIRMFLLHNSHAYIRNVQCCLLTKNKCMYMIFISENGNYFLPRKDCSLENSIACLVYQ